MYGELLLKLIVEHAYDRTQFDPEGWRELSKTVSLVNHSLNKWLNINSLRAVMLGERYSKLSNGFCKTSYCFKNQIQNYCWYWLWWPNGQLRLKMHYNHNDFYNECQKSWYENGVQSCDFQMYYNEKKLYKTEKTTWWPNGNVQSELKVEKNCVGYKKQYYENGRLRKEYTFTVYFKKHGEKKEYSKRGKLLYRHYYENGKLVARRR